MPLANVSPHCLIATGILIAKVLTDVLGYLKKKKLTSFCEIVRQESEKNGGKTLSFHRKVR